MRYRRAITCVVLIAIGGVLAYFAIGAYVRNSARGSLKAAAIHLQNNEPARIHDALKWLLWFEPNNPQVLHLAGLGYLQQQNLPAAINCLESVSADTGVYADAQTKLAAALLADRQFERAEAALKQFLLNAPDSFIAARMLSGLYLTELRQIDAVDVLERFLQNSKSAPLTFSDQLLLLRDLSTAEFHPLLAESCQPALTESLEKFPDQPYVRLALGRCEWELGNLAKAEPLLTTALQQRPYDATMRIVVAEFLMQQNNVDAAEAVLRDRPENPSTALIATEPAVIKMAQVYIQYDERYWELLCRIAESRGEFEAALEAIEQAASLRPANREYVSHTARLLQRANRADEARSAYELSHELARVELDLWNITRDLGGRLPTTADCEYVAQRYERLQKSRQAVAWRSLALQIEQETATGLAR